MSRAWDEERRRLQDDLVRMGDAGRAEGAAADQLARSFYPVAEHLRLLDQDVVLVVGPRGSGKSQIARWLTEVNATQMIGRFAPRVRLPQSATWQAVFPGGRDMFDPNGLRQFAAAQTADAMRDVWLAYLLRQLKARLSPQHQEALNALWQPAAPDIARVHAAFQPLSVAAVTALDDLDRALEERDEHLIVLYDELDTLGHSDWKAMEVGLRGLTAFWAAYTRRWRRLRAKLFIRSDLYERHARTGGADLYKLAAGRVELNWSDRDLYAMLLKRLANASDGLASYVREAKGIVWDKDPDLGWIPKVQRAEDARAVIERMVGPYMGTNQKKGHVYRWLLDHVRDGLGRAYPRPLVTLVEKAASAERRNDESLPKPRLIQPTALRRALDDVSVDHFTDAATGEWPWLTSLRAALQVSPLVPYTDADVIRLLEPLSSLPSPAQEPERMNLPFSSREMLAYLLELGVLRRRPDQRIDAPDLFLFGLGLKRKGGVARRQRL